MKVNGVNIDMWYGDSYKDATSIDITFYPNDCEYRGNIYKDNKYIGDYSCMDSVALEKTFNWLQFNWG